MQNALPVTQQKCSFNHFLSNKSHHNRYRFFDLDDFEAFIQRLHGEDQTVEVAEIDVEERPPQPVRRRQVSYR